MSSSDPRLPCLPTSISRPTMDEAQDTSNGCEVVCPGIIDTHWSFEGSALSSLGWPSRPSIAPSVLTAPAKSTGRCRRGSWSGRAGAESVCADILSAFEGFSGQQ